MLKLWTYFSKLPTWRLLVWCTIVNTSMNTFCFCESLLLGRKCVQFKWFSPISQYLDDVKVETTVFGYPGSSPKPVKIVGQIKSGFTEVSCICVLKLVVADCCLVSINVATGVSLINIRLLPSSTWNNIKFVRYSFIWALRCCKRDDV